MAMSILIVDDDNNFIDTLEDGLKLKNIDAQISVARSAREAMEVLAKAVPSVIILDIQLPDMHGVEFLRVIRESARLKTVPVLFISAKYTEPADRAEGLLCGADAYLSKPVHPNTILDEMDYLLDRTR